MVTKTAEKKAALLTKCALKLFLLNELKVEPEQILVVP